jgi:hypothetical protein
MSEPTVVIIQGDVVTERPMTETELEQLAKDKAANEAFNAEMLPKELAAVAARTALLAKLGITEEEARLLLGGN